MKAEGRAARLQRLLAATNVGRLAILLGDVLDDILALGAHLRVGLEGLEVEVSGDIRAQPDQGRFQGLQPDGTPGTGHIGYEINFHSGRHNVELHYLEATAWEGQQVTPVQRPFRSAAADGQALYAAKLAASKLNQVTDQTAQRVPVRPTPQNRHYTLYVPRKRLPLSYAARTQSACRGAGVAPQDPIEISLRRVDSLTVSELDDIWAVTSRYIDTDRSVFEARLRTLPQVGLWQVRGGPLVGLVNFDVYPVTWQGRVTTIIFTSSVVWPRRDQPTPTEVARFMDQLAQQRYGADWRPKTGVVSHFGQKRLLPTAAPVDAAALSDPDVRFFGQVNPGHRAGDRLVCLAPLSVANLTGSVARMLRF